MADVPTWHPSTLHQYGRVLRRRKWVVILCTLLVPAVAELVDHEAAPRYEATASVLLIQQSDPGAASTPSLAAALTDPERFAKTEAAVARSPYVAKRTVQAAGVGGRTADSFLAVSSVTPSEGADVLVFRVTDGDRQLAARLANKYVDEFIRHQHRIDVNSITRTRRGIQQRLRTLELGGDFGSALHKALALKDQQYGALLALQGDPAFPIRTALSAEKVSPRPVRDGLVGVVFGFVLGAALAFLWDSLDTRVRSATEASTLLGLRLLGRLPRPRRREREGVVMLAAHSSAAAEPYRVLRTSTEFAQLDADARLVMITSATNREGKSTTAANLAVALAAAGRHVNLVDLDLRYPAIASRFGLRETPGVTDLALGRLTPAEATVRIPLPPPESVPGDGYAGDGNGRRPRELRVLPSGSRLADPGEFISSEALAKVLAQLRDEDREAITLIDAPPLLGVGDSLALTAYVDAVIVVARLGVVRRSMLEEVHRLLSETPVLQLGVVVTGARAEKSYYDSGSRGGRRRASRPPARAPSVTRV